MSGTLKDGEPHPAVESALNWLRSQDLKQLSIFQESFSSCAIEGNRLAEICSETLQRLMDRKPVSDRYLLGLVWTMRYRGDDK